MTKSHDYPGTFITFEGGDGVGKSTHIKFLAGILHAANIEVVQIREPGGTSIGEQLRAIVLDPHNAEITPETELLIYEAARAQIVSQVIIPALKRDAVVLCDRFCDSTIAYQGYGRDLDRNFIADLNDFSCKGIMPDKTILIMCSKNEEKLDRVQRRPTNDRLELAGGPFHSNVSSGFREIAESNPQRVSVIDASGKHSETALQIFEALSSYFPWLTDGSVDFDEALMKFDESHIH